MRDEDFLADGIFSVTMDRVGELDVYRRIRCVKLRGAKHNPGIFTLERPLVEAFQKNGFVWGATFSNQVDLMHFEVLAKKGAVTAGGGGVDPAGTRKSLMTPMCCMLDAPLSPACTGLMSASGV